LPLPWIHPDAEWLAGQQQAGRPVIRFGDIHLDWSDFRLTLRQTADILKRFDVIEAREHQGLLALARDGDRLQPLVQRWYEATSGVDSTPTRDRSAVDGLPNLDQVLVLALRPFIARSAEALGQRADLSAWRQ